MKKRIFLWILLSVIVLGAGFRIAQSLGAKKGKERKEEIIPVRVVRPEVTDLEEILNLTGDVRGFSEAKVYAKVAGKLHEKVRDTGEVVSRNQTVALVDRDEPALEFKLSEVNAPLEGVITRYFLDIGESVNPQTPIFEVASIDKVKVVVNITEKDISRVRKGLPVRFTVDAYPGRVFSGRISRISQSIDLQSRTISVEMEVANPQQLLKPGMFARVDVILSVRRNVRSLPQDAVGEVDGIRYVYVIDQNRAFRREIVTGVTQNTRVEVKKGLADSDAVVFLGWQNLSDGVPVEVVE